jgi:hypothetical protein
MEVFVIMLVLFLLPVLDIVTVYYMHKKYKGGIRNEKGKNN